jgi:small-conductance mechanosensitive channel
MNTLIYALVNGAPGVMSTPIELLYLLPLTALAAFLFVIMFRSQNRGTAHHLTDQVSAFNSGHVAPYTPAQTSTEMMSMLSRQQTAIERMYRENSGYSKELGKLVAKINRLKKDNEMVSSENQALRQRMRKLLDEVSVKTTGVLGEFHIQDTDTGALTYTSNVVRDKATAMNTKNLYEDTQVFKTPDLSTLNLDDTSEFDLRNLR